MGYLHIGLSDFVMAIDDRTLAHLKIVILSGLRQGCGIALTLRHERSEGSGRDTFWIHPGTDLRFRFVGSRVPRLNDAWLQEMVRACKSSTGLYLMSEPAEHPSEENAGTPLTGEPDHTTETAETPEAATMAESERAGI